MIWAWKELCGIENIKTFVSASEKFCDCKMEGIISIVSTRKESFERGNNIQQNSGRKCLADTWKSTKMVQLNLHGRILECSLITIQSMFSENMEKTHNLHPIVHTSEIGVLSEFKVWPTFYESLQWCMELCTCIKVVPIIYIRNPL